MSSSPASDPAAEAAAMAAAQQAAEEFYREVWTLLGVAFLVVVLRTFARYRAVGFRNFQPDDYLVWLALTFHGIESGLAYSVGAWAHGLANNGMTDEERAALSPGDPEYELRVRGSIIQLCGWSSYSIVLWSLKAALLVLYMRLTDGLARSYIIRIYVGFGIVVSTWLIVTLNLFLACRPFHRMWQIHPDPGNVCQPAVSNQVVWGYYTFNVLTDLYLLSIPLPLLWGTTLKTYKKVGMIVLFGGGMFVIVCATLRCVYIVTDPINGAQLAGSWAVRETFVAVVTTNLPLIFPLVKSWLTPMLGPLMSSVRSTKRLTDGTPNELRTFGGGGGSGPSWRGRGPPTANPITNFTFTESEERMVGDAKMQDAANNTWAHDPNGDAGAGSSGLHSIQKSVEVEVVREPRASGEYEQPQQHPHSQVPQRSLSRGHHHQKHPWERGEHSAFASGPG
ncbi:hypothetical protein SODALDRAFT_332106 [Sodiomyces alkalinus F11]|uniref:Rhodopsin domain-containing protein n=1 Tax=Sodiomyces alkalinus (strain CBS 110278 / VKM F-3762 / F11) TaxID=1314773 RepID=A0A3N2PZK6_SODAK|nr:hypothetical protein SODALDRAFT_332106 [Sodiomyces alkalinus F11]ROT39959.1 hypothetical protein SODALDRAFT_332106 [Sodiomyces alkalinus F11]